jgi:transposase
MITKRRRYDAEFKRNAIDLALHSDKTMAEIEQEFAISKGLLKQWVRRARLKGEEAFRGNGEFSSDAERIRLLERENDRLRMDNEILKKAIAICTHPS